ncbi:hypothetical protein D9758_001057 [Tetrapyrgos nigripes]|uniref:Histone deacetylase interacting domain-containing protein n=1 Tax=Tetrapyrgos nigripes TaxID=182062 RepID=A0A8H5GRU9_9AGAR|nr:hypothetical protein D9758_001057 [Tetrapyrgos nigripes]
MPDDDETMNMTATKEQSVSLVVSSSLPPTGDITNSKESKTTNNPLHLSEKKAPEEDVEMKDVATRTLNGSADRPLTPVSERSASMQGLLLKTTQPVEDHPQQLSSSSSKPPAMNGESQIQSLDRPLNVTDALSYLDAVKNKFHDRPDVYNHFLDIMKEFKSQQIDTPGVIKRVSQLFSGHPSLIQGFNTFLPAGYRIECSVDASQITVTTPRGTTIHTTDEDRSKGEIFWATSDDTPSNAKDQNVGPSGHTSTLDAAVLLHGQPTQAMEPAVAYVQKIKQRCDPETYRQFLDILSRYHHKPDTIDEEEVSKQVGRLFKDAPDLRADFRIFMPDKNQSLLDDHAYAEEKEHGRHHKAGTPSASESKGKRKLDAVASSMNASLPQKKKRKAGDKDKERDRERERERDKEREKEISREKDKEREREAVSSTSKAIPNSKASFRALAKRSKQETPGRGPNVASSSRTNQVPGAPLHQQIPSIPSTSRAGAPTASATIDDTQFFDRVKRALDSRETYNEFLKVVNLFTQGYIDTARLVKESRNFLGGDGELMRQFKTILGWDERKERESWLMEHELEGSAAGGHGVKGGWTKPVIVEGIHNDDTQQYKGTPGRVDMNLKYGSYRKLPAHEMNMSCSGRDDMCRSVLNDEWVSHPSWGSEDTGFSVNKKNIYEEALHRSEEERHEYDFHIEAIVRTIAILEPINNKIAQLLPEERNGFKLKPNLGGSAKAIHQRVIKKIYGREAGLEVIQAMQDSPANAIPIVLQRLKQKEEEWKRAQREWNKVWREVDARNYAKSLDHQSITFKTADKKAITAKAFVNQIEASREEQMAKRASLIDPLFARTRPRHQLEFVVDDVAVLQDTLKLTFSFLDRMQGQTNTTVEKKRIETFLRSFVPLFFMLDPVAFNMAFQVPTDGADTDLSDDGASVADDAEGSNVAGSSKSSGRGRKNAVPALSGGDLRKKLLKSEQAKSSRKTRAQEAATPSVSRLASPAPMDDEQIAESSSNRRAAKQSTFFANTSFYVLLRLLEVFYSRLGLFKNYSQKLAGEPENRAVNLVAATVKNGDPPPRFANIDERRATAAHYYELLLESCERLFDNEIEQSVFEDQMRSMFGIKNAYKIFTVDKLIAAIIKQVQNVIADSKSQDLLEALKRDRPISSLTTQDQINSRRNAEKVLGPDENLFRIDWLSEYKTMTVQLLGKDDSSFNDAEVLTGRWQSYIDSYVSNECTTGVPQAKVNTPFLRRNLRRSISDSTLPQPDVTGADGLEIKICVRTYRLFFVSHTEDYLCAVGNPDSLKQTLSRLEARDALRWQWLEKILVLMLLLFYIYIVVHSFCCNRIRIQSLRMDGLPNQRLALLLVSAAAAIAASSQSFENSAIVRTVDLGGALVHVTTTFAAKALESSAKAYTITLPDEEIYRTSWLEVKIKGQQQPLTVTYGGAPADSKFHNLDVQLPNPLELNSTVNIVLETIQTHATYPWPGRASQQEEQALKYNTTLFVLSPYKTVVQRTKVKAPSPEIRDYSTPKNVDAFTLENPVTKSGATITYGPFNNLPDTTRNEWTSKNQQLVSVHYKYDYPVLELTTVKRAAEISHWGANLNIQDDIVLHNAGPQLKGHFSRLEHQTQNFYKRAAAHVIPALSLHLPAGIHDVYYYDLIGNVSTSRLRAAPSVPKNSKGNQFSVLELRPRYPLLGGWNYTFTLGWDSPLADSASYDKETGKYIVQVPIMTDLPGALLDDCEVKIILPEGATDVEYVLPFPALSTEESTHITYLDTVGRPALTFKYKNLTTKHAKAIYVSYKVPFSVHFRKPLAVTTALLSLFVFGVFARRVDLSLHKKTKTA